MCQRLVLQQSRGRATLLKRDSNTGDSNKSLQTGHLPREHLSFLQNLLNFIITKYLKKSMTTLAFEWTNIALLWPFYSWIYKGISESRDQKVTMLLLPMEKYPMYFYEGVVFTAQIWQSIPFVTGYKNICQSNVIMR